MDTAPKKRICKLDVKIQSLLDLICDIKAMEECVLEMKFDTRKAPLGESDRIRNRNVFVPLYFTFLICLLMLFLYWNLTLYRI